MAKNIIADPWSDEFEDTVDNLWDDFNKNLQNTKKKEGIKMALQIILGREPTSGECALVRRVAVWDIDP